MQKWIAAIFITLLLSNTTEFRQLFRLPFLISHYMKHREVSPSMSVFGFLHLHYQHGSDNDNDDNEDSNLPFKNISEPVSVSNFLVSDKPPTPMPPLIYLSPKAYRYHCFIPSQISFQVFHPPRMA